MLPSFRDQGPGRTRRRSLSHSSIYGSHKSARISKASLLSTSTVQTNGSGGSNSTITQESYNKSRKRKSSTAKEQRGEHRPQRPMMPPLEELPQGPDENEEAAADVDVFAYMVDDTQPDTAEPVLEHEGDEDDEPAPVPYPDDAVHERDFNSDSGIFMDEPSLYREQPHGHGHMHAVAEDEDIRYVRTTLEYPQVPRPQNRPPMLDEFYPVDTRGRRLFEPAYPERTVQPYWTPPPSVLAEAGIVPPNRDRLAVQYAGMAIPPLFKVFRKANYTILLYLQDQIMDLEDELVRLETYCQSRRHSVDGMAPEALHDPDRAHRPHYGFDTHAVKVDLMHRLQSVMDQYR
jgi:hypothetical protein